MRLTDERLQAIRDRLAAATPFQTLYGPQPPVVTLGAADLADLLAEIERLRSYDPCHGAEEQHVRHLEVCVPWYEYRDGDSPEAPDIPGRLAILVAATVEQARIDKTSCPTCGGDRLRADFTTPGRCHVPGGRP